MIQFLLNWPVSLESDSVISWIFFIINVFNFFILSAIFIMSIFEDGNLFKNIFKKLNIKTSIFYIIWILLLPLSFLSALIIGLIVLTMRFSYLTLVILVSWVFDIESKTKNNFSEWIKKIIKKKDKIKQQSCTSIFCVSKCKHGQYSNKSIYDLKCNLLELEFSRDECPCEGKLFEKE